MEESLDQISEILPIDFYLFEVAFFKSRYQDLSGVTRPRQRIDSILNRCKFTLLKQSEIDVAISEITESYPQEVFTYLLTFFDLFGRRRYVVSGLTLELVDEWK